MYQKNCQVNDFPLHKCQGKCQDSLRALMVSSALPKPNFSKTRFQRLCLFHAESKAEHDAESDSLSDSDTVTLSHSALASSAAVPVVAGAVSIKTAGYLKVLFFK